ncbi:MAG: septum formation initiator family protein [Dehalococcoidia bacterium]|nr:MAG: septum formation initiator family protein [Dehalococcoidia bacterium]
MSKKNYMLLGIIAIIVIFSPGYFRLKELKQKNQGLLEQIDRLRQENQDLASQVKRLGDDPFYIEKRARDKMGIGREGEVRYKLVYDDEDQIEKTDDDKSR